MDNEKRKSQREFKQTIPIDWDALLMNFYREVLRRIRGAVRKLRVIRGVEDHPEFDLQELTEEVISYFLWFWFRTNNQTPPWSAIYKIADRFICAKLRKVSRNRQVEFNLMELPLNVQHGLFEESVDLERILDKTENLLRAEGGVQGERALLILTYCRLFGLDPFSKHAGKVMRVSFGLTDNVLWKASNLIKETWKRAITEREEDENLRQKFWAALHVLRRRPFTVDLADSVLSGIPSRLEPFANWQLGAMALIVPSRTEQLDWGRLTDNSLFYLHRAHVLARQKGEGWIQAQVRCQTAHTLLMRGLWGGIDSDIIAREVVCGVVKAYEHCEKECRQNCLSNVSVWLPKLPQVQNSFVKKCYLQIVRALEDEFTRLNFGNGIRFLDGLPH